MLQRTQPGNRNRHAQGAFVALYLLPGIGLAMVLSIIVAKVLLKAPEFDEAEVLHASWLMANVGSIWIDVFEHHSPLFNAINSWIFNTSSDFFVVQAKLFALFTYLLGTYLFALSCYLWLNVVPAFRVPFLLCASTFYIALTWPVDIGVVRPENYSMLVLMAGSLFSYHVGKSSSAQSYFFASCSAFFLTLAISFSPRSIVLASAIVLATSWQARNRLNWLGIGVAACFGGSAAILCNLIVAPLGGFYLWMFEFNRHLLPYLREFSAAAYGTVVVALISIVMNVLWLAARLPASMLGRIQRSRRDGVTSLGAHRSHVGLFAAQVAMLACWIFVFVDHHWGRQSFGGIAVAASFYIAALIAFIFALSERMAGRFAGFFRTMSALPPGRVVTLLCIMLTAGSALLYLSVDKIYRMISRLQPSGMLTDISLMLKEPKFRLQSPNDLLPLSEARNLGEWLLWSKRYCAMLRDDHGLASPHRHPVCIKDATFYWYAGVHFRAMARHDPAFVPNPPYDVVTDILAKKPAFIDTAFLGDSVLPNTSVEAMLKVEYVLIKSDRIGEWAWLRSDFLACQNSTPH